MIEVPLGGDLKVLAHDDATPDEVTDLVSTLGYVPVADEGVPVK